MMSGRKKRRATRSGREHLGSTTWAGLYGDLYPQVRSWFAARVAREQDADDLAAQVFAEWAGTKTLDSPPAYVDGIARKVLSRYRRRRAKERTVLRRLLQQAIIGHDGPRPQEAGEPSGREELDVICDGFLAEVLGGLSSEQAELLRLRFVEGLCVAEVARRVGCSREAVYKRLQRLIKQLREEYRVEPNPPADRDNKQNS